MIPKINGFVYRLLIKTTVLRTFQTPLVMCKVRDTFVRRRFRDVKNNKLKLVFQYFIFDSSFV